MVLIVHRRLEESGGGYVGRARVDLQVEAVLRDVEDTFNLNELNIPMIRKVNPLHRKRLPSGNGEDVVLQWPSGRTRLPTNHLACRYDVPASANERLGCCASSRKLATSDRRATPPSSTRDTVSFPPCHCTLSSRPSFPHNPSSCGSRISPIRPPTWTSQTSCECVRGQLGS